MIGGHSPNQQFFADRKRRIDFVLVHWNADPNGHMPKEVENERKADQRRVFENNLKKMGLELENGVFFENGLHFTFVHAPFSVLTKQAELLKLKKAVQKSDVEKTKRKSIYEVIRRKSTIFGVHGDTDHREHNSLFYQPFVEQHIQLFLNHKDPDFFTQAERSRLVNDILIRTRFADDEDANSKLKFGIERLINLGAYYDFFPLHDDFIKNRELRQRRRESNDREILFDQWVRPSNWRKTQPLDLIEDDICGNLNVYMCPTEIIKGQGVSGNPVPLNSSCHYAKVSYVFDNNLTIIYAAVLSIWATVFLEIWKREQAKWAYRWHMLGFEDEDDVIRPEFQLQRKHMRINPVTQQAEPYIPWRYRFLRFSLSGVTVIFFVSLTLAQLLLQQICLVVALCVGVTVYRIIVRKAVDQSTLNMNTTFISVTASLINLVFILIMNYVYSKLALKLTEWECPRTQGEFDNNYTTKVFLFQFVNFYSSLFYTAFFRGKFSGKPPLISDSTDSKTYWDGLSLGYIRGEECDPAGCMVELVIQLFITMCGKQFVTALAESVLPIAEHRLRKLWHNRTKNNKNLKASVKNNIRRAVVYKEESLTEKNYTMNPVPPQFLFEEYLEIVIQFGFCAMFAAAFPLAPFFAFLNNIIEIRVDAYKFVVNFRRPVALPSKGIGVWLSILELLSTLAVISNAMIIAFTSNFIPRTYYFFTNGNLDGYVLNSMTATNMTDLKYESGQNQSDIDFCYFKSEYKRWDVHGWMIFALRLTFHFVLLIKKTFSYMIPDVPDKVVLQLQRQRYLARQAVLNRLNERHKDTDTNEVIFEPGENVDSDDPSRSTSSTPHEDDDLSHANNGFSRSYLRNTAK